MVFIVLPIISSNMMLLPYLQTLCEGKLSVLYKII